MSYNVKKIQRLQLFPGNLIFFLVNGDRLLTAFNYSLQNTL